MCCYATFYIASTNVFYFSRRGSVRPADFFVREANKSSLLEFPAANPHRVYRMTRRSRERSARAQPVSILLLYFILLPLFILFPLFLSHSLLLSAFLICISDNIFILRCCISRDFLHTLFAGMRFVNGGEQKIITKSLSRNVGIRNKSSRYVRSFFSTRDDIGIDVRFFLRKSHAPGHLAWTVASFVRDENKFSSNLN